MYGLLRAEYLTGEARYVLIMDVAVHAFLDLNNVTLMIQNPGDLQ